MARALTPDQKQLLRADAIAVNVLATFFLDEGTYHFCDDVLDLSHGATTYIGANALVQGVEVSAGSDLVAEPTTLVCDGQRMADFGIEDPARVLNDMMEYLHHQRRVDIALGFRYPTQRDINLVIPVYAGKINNVRLIDASVQLSSGSQTTSARLEIVLDSLAARYNRASHRTRSHADQLEIDPTDNFFNYVISASQNDRKLYWGKRGPNGSVGIGGGIGGGRLYPTLGDHGNVVLY